jgi:hypothetical protein
MYTVLLFIKYGRCILPVINKQCCAIKRSISRRESVNGKAVLGRYDEMPSMGGYGARG